MQVTETLVEGLTRKFSVVVPATKVEADINTRLTELAQAVRLPGFRPGKVPLALVRKRYGDSIKGEVLDQTVRETSQQAVTERGLRPAGQPKVEIKEFEEGRDLKYELSLEIMPEFAPMDFSTLKLDRMKVLIGDSDVEEDLKRLARRFRTSKPVDPARPAAKGDIVVVDFVGRIDGQEFDGGKAEDHELELGSGSFIGNFEDQLLGAGKGDKREVTVTFPTDYLAVDLAGKTAVFAVVVKEVRIPDPLQIDDELAKKVGLDSFDALKRAARERLERQSNALARSSVKRKLLDLLAENHTFQVPPGLVQSEYDAIVARVTAANSPGAPPADQAAAPAEPSDSKISDKDKAEFRSIAERRVRLGLLLSEVGRRNNIQVTEDEMKRALVGEANRYPGKEREVVDFYQKNPAAVANLRAPIYEDKVVDFILELAQVAEKPISAAELMRQQLVEEPQG
jgi:trigger factor